MTLALLILLGASPQLKAAEKLLREARFEGVGATLEPLLGDERAPAGDRAKANVLVGLALHNLQDAEGARAAFRRALELDRAVGLPDRVSPRTVALFNDVKAKLAPVAPLVSLVTPPIAVEPEPQAPAITLTPRPEPRLRAPRLLSFVGGGLAVVSAIVGGLLMNDGLQGRALAVANPVGLTAEAQFLSANRSYGWGSGLLITAGALLAISVVLFFLPGATP